MHTRHYPYNKTEQKWPVDCRHQVLAEVADNSSKASTKKFPTVEAY